MMRFLVSPRFILSMVLTAAVLMAGCTSPVPEAETPPAAADSIAPFPDAVELSGAWQPVIWGTSENPKPARLPNVSAADLPALPSEITLSAEEPEKFTFWQWGDCRLRFDLKGDAKVLLQNEWDIVALAGVEAGGEWTTYDAVFRAPRWKEGAKVSEPQLEIAVNGGARKDSLSPKTNDTAPGEQINEDGEQFGPLQLKAVNGQAAAIRNLWVGPIEPARDTSAMEWKDMFDGKTLNGWSINGGEARYRLENGEIVGTTVFKSKNTFLITDADYKDFDFSVEFHGDVPFNAGIQFRSHARDGRGRTNRTYGYQCEIDPSDRMWTAGIYDEANRGWLHPLNYLPERRTPIVKGQWNQFRIFADGAVLKTWFNGKLISHIYDRMASQGYFGLQVHGVKEEEPMEIRWRNVKIKVLE